ncbi:aminotransferase class III-fold pyridoxal phosphate-dependent enzyme [Pacificispira sp.]|uniref:aminotransferase class III-fold pyridoxal phosphate-dependent enzyme n=1 Tax=Pacificispira sp. TaxID=2888761 RepID=UPI002EBC25AB|nr:aminotransferase class III-fold pyridoxal phosphate-dependent enzyme [Pseudomonadota bacterium]
MSALHDRHRAVLMPWHAQSKAHGGPAFNAGEGCFLIEESGNRIFDFSSGWIAANLGHGHPRLIKAIADQAARLYYAPPIFVNDTRAELAARLSDLSPWPDGARVHFTSGGGEANDDAIKAARMITGRHKILAAYRSYHGTTGGASGATGDMRRWPNEPSSYPAVRFFAPYPYRSPFHTDDPDEEVRRAMDHLDRIVTQEGAHNIAALLIEPMVGSSGLIRYPDGYLDALRRFTEERGILLIFDEVMTGFGRVGAAFAAERFQVAPDMIVFAKGVNGAAIPLGGLMIREGVARHFDDTVFDAGHTHAGHPIAMASGVAALDAYEQGGLFTRARALEDRFRDRLTELRQRHAVIGDIRGAGAFWGIELVRDRATKEPLVPWYAKDASLNYRLTERMLQDGNWVYARYGILMLAPPLIVTDEELDAAMAQLSRSLTWLESQI